MSCKYTGESTPLSKLKDALSSREAFSRHYLVSWHFSINCCKTSLFIPAYFMQHARDGKWLGKERRECSV